LASIVDAMLTAKGSHMADEKVEITRLINLYIDGAGKGDASKLNEAFHSSARWFGTMGGTDYDLDKQAFVDLMVSQPGDGGNLTATITDIQVDGTAAVATVKEEGFWGIYAFTDYFTLSILEGRWQITNKTFANTGVASA
jgi:Putative lumazine-binding